MVRVVNNSCYGYGYLENNRQLARRVSELEQQLGAAIQEIQNLREISHRKEVRIVELEATLNELQGYRAKHDAIKHIILGTRSVQSRTTSIHQTTSIHALTNSEQRASSPLQLPSVSHIESGDEDEPQDEREDSRPGSPTSQGSKSTLSANESEKQEESTMVEETDQDSCEQDNSGRLTENVLQPIIEGSEEENEDEEDHDGRSGSTHASLPSPSPTRTISRADSLEPANDTTVPSITHQERTMHTPSIWNCLDPLESASQSSQKLPDQEQRSQSRKLTQSPARSAVSSISVGLRLSQSVNSSSPIQPITRKANSKLDDDVFHSTPAKRDSLAKEGKRRLPVKRAVKFPVEMNQANQGVEEASAAAAVAAPPSRYNLRKRVRR